VKRLSTLSLPLLAALLAVVSGCSREDSVGVSETQFEDAFVRPLDASGLDYSVVGACHYARQDVGEPWNFQIRVVVDADPNEVADALEATVDIIERDRSPMILQQYAGEPGRGWDGTLESHGEGTVLGVVKNNVTVDGDRPSVGWLPVCEFPR
jgi:hypothetical protein